MDEITKTEIFCHRFKCGGCPFNGHTRGCRLANTKDKDLLGLTIKSDRFNEYSERAKRLGVTLSNKVVLR